MLLNRREESPSLLPLIGEPVRAHSTYWGALMVLSITQLGRWDPLLPRIAREEFHEIHNPPRPVTHSPWDRKLRMSVPENLLHKKWTQAL